MFLDILGINEAIIGLFYQIYAWVSNLYAFIFELASGASFFDSTYIDAIWKTLYSIAGIFMLFRIVISMLQYLVDPDKVTDKNTGGGKLAVRIVISIVLVLSMPFIFDFLDRVQNAILGTDGLLSDFTKAISKNSSGGELDTSNSYGGAGTAYFYNKDGFVTKILDKGFSLIVPEVKAESICDSSDEIYDFFDESWDSLKVRDFDADNIPFIKMYTSSVGDCVFSDKNDLETKMNALIKDAFSRLNGEEILFCKPKYKGANGTVCNTSALINWKGLNVFKNKLNDESNNYGICSSQSDFEKNNNCYNVYYLEDPSDSSKDGKIKDIVLERKCSNSSGDNFADCRFEVYVTYYQSKLLTLDTSCYYAYIGTSGSKYGNSGALVSPFQTYVKINFKGSNDDDYMNVEFVADEENQVKLYGNGEAQKITLKAQIEALLKSKGISTNQASLSKLDKFQTDIIAKSAGCWSSGDGCSEMNYKNNDITNIYSMLNNGNCPWIVFEGDTEDEDLNCYKEENSNAYGENGNYSIPAEYTCWIYGRKTLRLYSSQNNENSNNPRFTCPSKSFDEMVNCALYHAKSDGTGVESAFSTLDDQVMEDVLNKAKNELVSNWDSYGIIGVTKQEVGDYLNIYVEEEVSKVQAAKEDIEKFISANKRGNESANSFAGIMMTAFIDIVDSSNVDDDVMKCLDASRILHGSASNGGEKCENIIVDADDDDIIYVSAFIGLILGIIVIVLLATLAVDVVIRNAKLLLLQIISPVAILSFINPRDKIFSQWVKMYGATFADLFIKLLAIMLIPIILAIFNIGNQDSNMIKIFMILGVLAFAKAAPAFISKIFGISDMAGSFKDAGKMLKAAAFGAAGAGIAVGASAIGIGRNAYSAYAGGLGAKGAIAAGLRGASGMVGAGLRGFGAGSKGNIMAGAKSTWATASARSDLYRKGVGTSAQLQAGFLGGMFVGKKDKEVEDAYEDLQNKRASIDKELETDIVTKNATGYRMDAKKLSSDDSYKSLAGSEAEANKLCNSLDNKSVQDLHNMLESGRTFDGERELTAAERSFYGKVYADELDNAKAYRISEIMDNKEDKSTAKALMNDYDRTIDYYSSKLGKSEKSDDKDYSYDFTSLTKMSSVGEAAKKANSGKTYKGTKVGDKLNTFKYSKTRQKHQRAEEAIKGSKGGK